MKNKIIYLCILLSLLLVGCGSSGSSSLPSSLSPESVSSSETISSSEKSSEIISSSEETTSSETTSIISSSSKMSSSSQSSSIMPEPLVGTILASKVLSKQEYVTKTVTTSVGDKIISLDLNEISYNKNWGFQFSKGSDRDSVLTIKSVSVHIVKLTVFGYTLSQEEDGISLSADGVTFIKEASEVTGTNANATNTLTYTASAVTPEVDLVIKNNFQNNARYIYSIEFIA